MAKIKNKEVLQSYIITSAKYDFSVYEKRILYRQIEIEQELLNGVKIHPGVKIETNIWRDKRYTMPIQMFLNGEESKNHTRIKKAFKDLMSKIIEYEDEEKIIGFPLIMNYEVDKKGETVTWQCYSMMVDAIVNFAKGFRKYELKTAMEFESVYAMRFYELFSGQKQPLTFTIDKLKEIFKLENKYSDTNMFIKKVIGSAKKELDEKSPYSFDYNINKLGRKFHSITFIPKFQHEFRDQELEGRELSKKLSLGWDLPYQVINYFIDTFDFSIKELQLQRNLLIEANLSFDILNLLSEKKRNILNASNPKGYVITMLRNEVESKYKNKKEWKESIIF